MDHCSVFYYDNKYVLDKITKDNIDKFVGEYTCTAQLPGLDYSKTTATVISKWYVGLKFRPIIFQPYLSKVFLVVMFVFFFLQFDMKNEGTFNTGPSQGVLVSDNWSYSILERFLNYYTSYYNAIILSSYRLHTIIALSYHTSYYNTLILHTYYNSNYNHPRFG